MFLQIKKLSRSHCGAVILHTDLLTVQIYSEREIIYFLSHSAMGVPPTLNRQEVVEMELHNASWDFLYCIRL